MIYKPNQMVIVVKNQDQNVRKGMLFILTMGNNGDETIPLSGSYELKKDLTPTGARYNLVQSCISIFDRKERQRVIHETIELLNHKLAQLKNVEIDLIRYPSDADKYGEQILQAIKQGTTDEIGRAHV